MEAGAAGEGTRGRLVELDHAMGGCAQAHASGGDHASARRPPAGRFRLWTEPPLASYEAWLEIRARANLRTPEEEQRIVSDLRARAPTVIEKVRSFRMFGDATYGVHASSLREYFALSKKERRKHKLRHLELSGNAWSSVAVLPKDAVDFLLGLDDRRSKAGSRTCLPTCSELLDAVEACSPGLPAFAFALHGEAHGWRTQRPDEAGAGGAEDAALREWTRRLVERVERLGHLSECARRGRQVLDELDEIEGAWPMVHAQHSRAWVQHTELWKQVEKEKHPSMCNTEGLQAYRFLNEELSPGADDGAACEFAVKYDGLRQWVQNCEWLLTVHGDLKKLASRALERWVCSPDLDGLLRRVQLSDVTRSILGRDGVGGSGVLGALTAVKTVSGSSGLARLPHVKTYAAAWGLMDLPPLHSDTASSHALSLAHCCSILMAEPLSEIVAAVPAEILTCVVRSRLLAMARQRNGLHAQEDARDAAAGARSTGAASCGAGAAASAGVSHIIPGTAAVRRLDARTGSAPLDPTECCWFPGARAPAADGAAPGQAGCSEEEREHAELAARLQYQEMLHLFKIVHTYLDQLKQHVARPVGDAVAGGWEWGEEGSGTVWARASSELRMQLLALFDQTLHVCTGVGGAPLLRYHFPVALRGPVAGSPCAPLAARDSRANLAAGLRCLRDACRRFYRDAVTWPRWAAKIMHGAAWAEKRAAGGARARVLRLCAPVCECACVRVCVCACVPVAPACCLAVLGQLGAWPSRPCGAIVLASSPVRPRMFTCALCALALCVCFSLSPCVTDCVPVCNLSVLVCECMNSTTAVHCEHHAHARARRAHRLRRPLLARPL